MQRITERVLDGLARPLFPVAVANDAPRIQWLSAALLARIVDMAESALALSARDRQGDLGILVRCLFEHVVMLAWLTGADGAERHERMLLWQRYDDEQRLRAHREISALHDEPLLPEETRVRLLADVQAMGSRRMPGLADRALTADREWGGRLGFPLREVYSTLYRPTSAAVHPTQMALSLVVTRAPERTVFHLERAGTASATLAAVPGLLMVALLVSAYVFERPSLAAAEACLDRLLQDLANARLPEAGESRKSSGSG